MEDFKQRKKNKLKQINDECLAFINEQKTARHPLPKAMIILKVLYYTNSMFKVAYMTEKDFK